MTPYLTDASGYSGEADRVIVPASEVELLAAIGEARRREKPVTVAGAGTGVTGGRVPHGGWVVSLEKMTQLEVMPGRARAGAGVLLKDLHAAAERSHQFYPPDPTETWASVGGTIATNASGSRSFRYGSTRRYVEALRVVLMTGQARELRRSRPAPLTRKSTAGYLLREDAEEIDLFIGSEGTLGIITAAELRLLPAPAQLLAAVVFFASDEAALTAVDAWRPIDGLRMLEYLDSPSLYLLRARYAEIPAAAEAALLIEQELEGDEEIELWVDRLNEGGAMEEASWFGAGPEDRERFRQFRHAIPELINETVRRRGLTKMGTDFAVPVAKNREMLYLYRRDCERLFPGNYAIFGHVGDAHLHVNLLPADAEESKAASALMIDWAKAAVALGGTISAEHGLGKRKKHLLPIELGEREIAQMRAIKSRYDPEWLLGQGTLFSASSS